jgi:hypothetical protein
VVRSSSSWVPYPWSSGSLVWGNGTGDAVQGSSMVGCGVWGARELDGRGKKLGLGVGSLLERDPKGCGVPVLVGAPDKTSFLGNRRGLLRSFGFFVSIWNTLAVRSTIR